jgi:hypothetical protein
MHTSQFKALKVTHTVLLAGLAIFLIIAYVLISQGLYPYEKDKTTEMVFQAVAALISIGSLLVGFQMYKKRLVAARNDAGSGEARFLIYRGACIMWWAFLEAPALFAAIAYLKTGNLVFIILALFHLGLLAVFMPRKENIVLLLNLTTEDVQKLEGTTI